MPESALSLHLYQDYLNSVLDVPPELYDDRAGLRPEDFEAENGSVDPASL